MGAAGLGSLLASRVRGEDTDDRPNIVVVLSDDHRTDFMGVTGHPFIQTPNMDRMAREGAFFENAFITTSLCSPSRASYLTGLYASTHGCRNNTSTYNRKYPTFPELMAETGYAAAYVGKWHMPGPLPKLVGVDPFITFTVNAGQGQYFDCPLVRNGKPLAPRKRYVDEDLTEHAVEFMRANRQRPFCLFVGFKAPHHDWQSLPQHEQLYQEEEIPWPPESDPWLGFTGGNVLLGQMAWTPALYRRYCRSVTSTDFLLGRLMDSIADMGLDGRTLVIYCSDNGYLWGERRLLDKRWAYEKSIRVPMIVRAPGRIASPGIHRKQMVLNIDLAPTALSIGGAPLPAPMHGDSLLPCLDDPASPGRDALLYEHFVDFPYAVPAMDAIRTATHKYIEYAGDRPAELYDLVSDPEERTNLLENPVHKALAGQLKNRLGKLREKYRS